MRKIIQMLALASCFFGSCGAALADECNFTLNERQVSKGNNVFTWIHLISKCNQALTVNSIKLNLRDDCEIKIGQEMRMGDEYVFGLAKDEFEGAFYFEVHKTLMGREYFDLQKCGQPVRFDLRTSSGDIVFGEED